MSVFYKGDVFYILKKHIQDKSINLIYIDPPFGTTENYWDEELDWVALFKEMFRVLKDDGMIVIHCSVPFNYTLIRSAPRPPNYSWYWKKESPTCPLIANQQPMRIVEEILVWRKKRNTYYRQQIGTEEHKSKWATKSTYFQDNITSKKTIIKGKTRTHFLDSPRNLDGFSTRPDDIVDLMINSYSKPGDTILDLFCYKGLTYLHRANRKWIGIDKYFFPAVVVNGSS